MRIGALAAEAGVSVQTLRYYERRGLLETPHRSTAGFREYVNDSARRVRFIRKAQSIGFTLEEIRGLLGLWPDSAKACRAVEKRATITLSRIDAQVMDLRRMRRALSRYVSACRHGAALQQCPLLEGLGNVDGAARG